MICYDVFHLILSLFLLEFPISFYPSCPFKRSRSRSWFSFRSSLFLVLVRYRSSLLRSLASLKSLILRSTVHYAVFVLSAYRLYDATLGALRSMFVSYVYKVRSASIA